MVWGVRVEPRFTKIAPLAKRDHVNPGWNLVAESMTACRWSGRGRGEDSWSGPT